MRQVSFEYRDPEVRQVCEEVVRYGYEQVGTMLEGYLIDGLRRVEERK